ncbi:hypothetical protein [Paenibacillus daejeonensis]|uniref:hypothetical protein n=1 Tax=Paenibacillus daejeonensis TaxID=135193 RepID=UPI0003800A9A|nr:hypothetical protein [Paenibacillus daejeonensis]
MTAAMLLRALVAYLQVAVADYAAAQADGGRYTVPRVFDWYLPFKDPRKEEKIDFPYIVARIMDGEDPESEPKDVTGSTVHVHLSFGVYHPGTMDEAGFIHPDGNYDLLNLMEHVRMALQQQPLIDQRYRLEKPYNWDIPDGQPYPLWVGQAVTRWSVQSVTEQIQGVDLHGSQWTR